MNKYWSARVGGLAPYTPGEQPKDRKYIKLNTNENPYPPSPKAIEAMKEEAGASLRLYPQPESDAYREALADFLGVKKQQVYAGNGSDELLAFCFLAFFDPVRTILFPDITYSFYPVYAKLFGIEYREVPLNEDLKINVEDYFSNNGGIIFPNPNAPTGCCLAPEAIMRILDKNPETVVIVDEAYIDFGGKSVVGLINKYPNLLVVRTMSKSHSLAGIRAGYVVGDSGLVEAVARVKNSFNSYTMDRIALAGAEAAIRDTEYFNITRNAVMNTREKLKTHLAALGFNFTDSLANFIFISHKRVPAGLIFKELKNRGILVRYFSKPRIDNYLRVSMGTDEDMEKFTAALKEIVG